MGRVDQAYLRRGGALERFELLEPPQKSKPLGPPSTLGVTSATTEIDALRNGGATPDVVSDAGDCLMAAVRNQPDVNDAIHDMLRAVSTHPLYLELGTGAGKASGSPGSRSTTPRSSSWAYASSSLADREEGRATGTPPRCRGPRSRAGRRARPSSRSFAVIAPARKHPHDRKRVRRVGRRGEGRPSRRRQVDAGESRSRSAPSSRTPARSRPTSIPRARAVNVSVKLLASKADITDESEELRARGRPRLRARNGLRRRARRAGRHVRHHRREDHRQHHDRRQRPDRRGERLEDPDLGGRPELFCQTSANAGTTASFGVRPDHGMDPVGPRDGGVDRRPGLPRLRGRPVPRPDRPGRGRAPLRSRGSPTRSIGPR